MAIFNRRRFLAKAGITGFLATGAVAATPAAALASGPPAVPSPFAPHGSWSVTVTFPAFPGKTEQGIMAFTADGIVIESNSENRYAGLGGWEPVPGGGFIFGWREQLFSGSGELALILHVQQTATFTSERAFTSTGTGSAYDPAGNLVATLSSNIDATRYGIKS